MAGLLSPFGGRSFLGLGSLLTGAKVSAVSLIHSPMTNQRITIPGEGLSDCFLHIFQT